MSYHTNSLLSAQPTVDLMNELKTAIDNHPAWEFVEEVVSGANVAHVFRNISSVSGLAYDFYVVLRRTAATGNITVVLGEGYDSGTKLLSKFPLVIQNTSITNQADGTAAGTLHVGTFVVSGTPGGLGAHTTVVISTNTSGFTYYFSVQNQCLIHGNSATNGCLYVGSGVSLRSSTVFPGELLVIGKIGGTNNEYATATRDAVITAPYFGYVDARFELGIFSDSYINPAKDPAEGKWFAMPYIIYTRRGTSAPFYPRGYISLEHVKRMTMSEFTESLGDTVTIDGDTHTCFYAANASAWVSQAA